MVEIKNPVVEKIVRSSIFGDKVVTEFPEGKKESSKIKSKKVKKRKTISKKILRKPKVKLPSVSPRKFVEQLAMSQPRLVREVENPYADPVQDNRSQFFRESFAEEKRKAFGGFL